MTEVDSTRLRETFAVYFVLDLQQAGERADVLVSEALAGGMTALQLRDKRGTMAQVERVASRCRQRLSRAGVPLIVNDHLDVAVGVGADGVHVGQHDEDPETIRHRAKRYGIEDLIVGVSVTTVEEGRRALQAGASYLSVSPVFGTSSKSDTVRPVGLSGVTRLREAFSEVSIVAIGGIHAGRCEAVIRAGADGVAFVSAATGARSVQGSVREISASVRRALRERSSAVHPSASMGV